MVRCFPIALFSILFFFSCQKQTGLKGDARIFVSTDSLYFDTVFTSTGNITQQIKLINNYKEDITISNIALAGGTNSPFVINIDGTPGPQLSNLKINANDSLYIFVTVFVSPGGPPVPFIVEDSIQISYNGVRQEIKLSAWGQNAHFLKNQTITGNTIWSNDLPYVILGGLQIDTNASLTITAGAHIYLHADAPIYIDGTLITNGSSLQNQQIYFAGDRLDQPYNSYPGSWPGIFFRNGSHDNILNYAVFENGYHSLVVEGPASGPNPKLTLNQCIVNNSYAEGLLCIQTSVKSVNCLYTNCGQNIVINSGGDYLFEQCTVASYSTRLLSHQQPVITISNGSTDGSQTIIGDLNASFKNCIVWGSQSVQNELLSSKIGNSIYQVLFDHTILKQLDYPSDIDSNSLFLNANPQFLDTLGTKENPFDFHVAATSPAIKTGADLGISIDLDGNPRPVNQPDLGCYERQ